MCWRRRRWRSARCGCRRRHGCRPPSVAHGCAWCSRRGRWQRRPSRLASGWRMRKARRGLCLASSSAARVQGAARGRLARRLARRARRAIVSLQTAARRARAYAVSRVPPRWCSVWRAPKPRAHSPQAALSRAPRRDLQAACGRKARAVRDASPAGAPLAPAGGDQAGRSDSKAAGRAADAPRALDDPLDPGAHARGAPDPWCTSACRASPRLRLIARLAPRRRGSQLWPTDHRYGAAGRPGRRVCKRMGRARPGP